MAGIYLHIPFCKQACHYCNFYFSVSTGNKEKFIEALLKEIELTKEYLESEVVDTLYFGGGTPSLFDVEELKTILRKLYETHRLDGLKELTLEANPDDLSVKKITTLKELTAFGLNRFSIGIQSFRQEDLDYMNRAHRAEETVASVKRIQDAGFENVTIDLIYGTPTMNDEQWAENLNRAFALKVPHISAYALTVEPKTTLANRIKKKKCLAVNEEQSARQFMMLMAEMEKNGYEQYEISNFAKPGKYSLHNSAYWSDNKYLGLGPSAHSYNRVSRRWNVANNLIYWEQLHKGILPFQEEILTPIQKTNEKIMTSIRTSRGLMLNQISTDHRDEVMRALLKIDKSFYRKNGDNITLTPRGKLFADNITSQLFIEAQ